MFVLRPQSLRRVLFNPARTFSSKLALTQRSRLATRMAENYIHIHPDSDPVEHITSDRPEKKPRLDVLADDARKDESNEKPKAKQRAKKHKGKKHVLPEPYSMEDIVARDVSALLGQDVVAKAIEQATEWNAPFEQKKEIELVVSSLSSTGESLSISPSHRPWVVVAPLALPGETIRVRVYRHSRLHSFADLLKIVTPNPEWRDMSRVQCKYFGKCSGCQYQMLSYDRQLDLKRTVVVKAYQNFSGLPSTSVPPILPTMSSPLQYGYRTKITPHFDGPSKKLQKDPPPAPTSIAERPSWLNIGFNQIGTRHVLDIEECPIATPTLNAALGPLRENIVKNAYTYKKGVSLLLRESLEIRTPGSKSASPASTPASSSSSDGNSSAEKHICITNQNATVRERVGDKLFEYVANSFFQNNNSVLLPLTDYVRDAIFPPDDASSDAATRPTHLVDAYCGSGLFAITLAPHFDTVAGIELSADSIRCAAKNAELNNLPQGRCSFRAGDAADIFASVQEFPRERTALIIDPPRKGTDEKFIEQLLHFGCATVVYVSCNVHTQARDVGMILRKAEEEGGPKYVLETLRGFDLFPQTAHVESVAVLRRV